MARSIKKSKTIKARYTALPVKWLDIIEDSRSVFALIDIEPYMDHHIGPVLVTVYQFGKIKHS